MNKNRIRLSESQLHQVIKESVKKVLNENEDFEKEYLSKLIGFSRIPSNEATFRWQMLDSEGKSKLLTLMTDLDRAIEIYFYSMGRYGNGIDDSDGEGLE